MVWNAEQSIQIRPAEGTSGESSICVPTSAGCFIGDKMKRITLTQGQSAIVDDADYEWLNQWKWYARWSNYTKSFYAIRKSKTENGKQYTIYMARRILGLSKDDKYQADHIDHITLDNRRSNLRIVTSHQNRWNRKNPKGYYWHKDKKKYGAKIGLNGKNIHLGYFQTTREAHKVYLSAKEKYHQIESIAAYLNRRRKWNTQD